MSLPNNSGDRKDQLDFLELILQKNTKTIQQQGHSRILDIGSEAMSALEAQQPDNMSRWLAVEEAMTQADQVHQCQMKLALKKLRQEMEKDQALELFHQQQNYQTMAERQVKEFFENMEVRLKSLDKELEREISDDLDLAVQQFDIGRRLGVRQETAQLKTRLRNEFALEKERKIADNLRIARERFREKTLQSVRYVEEQSKKETMEMLEQKTKEHQRTLDHFKERFKILTSEIVRLEDSSFRLNLASKDLSAEYRKLLSRVEVKSELVRPQIPMKTSAEPKTRHSSSSSVDQQNSFSDTSV